VFRPEIISGKYWFGTGKLQRSRQERVKCGGADEKNGARSALKRSSFWGEVQTEGSWSRENKDISLRVRRLETKKKVVRPDGGKQTPGKLSSFCDKARQVVFFIQGTTRRVHRHRKMVTIKLLIVY